MPTNDTCGYKRCDTLRVVKGLVLRTWLVRRRVTLRFHFRSTLSAYRVTSFSFPQLFEPFVPLQPGKEDSGAESTPAKEREGNNHTEFDPHRGRQEQDDDGICWVNCEANGYQGDPSDEPHSPNFSFKSCES